MDACVNLTTWAERLEKACEALRRRQSEDIVRDVALESIESVAAEMRIAGCQGHISTWPAPGNNENG